LFRAEKFDEHDVCVCVSRFILSFLALGGSLAPKGFYFRDKEIQHRANFFGALDFSMGEILFVGGRKSFSILRMKCVLAPRIHQPAFTRPQVIVVHKPLETTPTNWRVFRNFW
jgi:hypothetical protein